MTSEELAASFEDVFQRLLIREKRSLDTPDVSLMFEVIATGLMGPLPGREEHYFDGAVGVEAVVETTRKVQFRGEMWIGGHGTQWTEPFVLTVTDKRSTKQGVWLRMKIGADIAEANLSSAFGVH